MDLLEYQGKQLFSKHGVPVPAGRPATTVYIRDFTVHELYVEKASEIDEEYYAAIAFDRSAKKPMGTMLGAAEKVVELAGAAA
jgi:succinyl-CoA synthetase beta subunit